MKFLRKLTCFIISIILFACPIYSNANYYNSLLEVHAEDTTMHYNRWLVLFLASLGLSVSSMAPNPFNWAGDELEKFIKRYQEDEQERIQNALIEWKAQMNELKGKPIVEVPPILYNVFNDFVNYIKTDHGLTSSNHVTIGNILTKNYVPLANTNPNVRNTLSYPWGTHDFTVIDNDDKVSDIRTVYCFYLQDGLIFENIYLVHQGTSKVGFSGFSGSYYISKYDITYNQFLTVITEGSSSYSHFSKFVGTQFPKDSNLDVYLYGLTFGDQAILDDKVIGAGDLKLDDRVLETDDKATLDLTKVNFGQGVGVDATIADISKWLNGVINGTQDLDWGKVVPIPDVKPIPIPEPTTAPLPTTEPIPTSEPVPTATPFPPGDIEQYQTPSLTNVFPFCVPYDVVKFFDVLNAEPQAPKWTFDLDKISKGYKVVVDMSEFEKPIIALRYSLLALFIFGLILVTRRIIGG